MLVSRVVKNRVDRIPLEEQTPAFKIFHWRYPIMISGIHLMSPEFVAQTPMIVSGDPKADIGQLRALVEVQYTIADMATAHGDGIPFRLAKPENSAEIYRVIMDHLRGWMQAIREDPNRQVGQEKDLVLLDRLAGEIYKYAQYYIKPDAMQGSAHRYFAEAGRRRGVGRVRMTEEERKRVSEQMKAPTVRPTEHSSLASAIIAESRLRS